MGRDFGHQRDYSEAVAADIDEEVRTMIDLAHHEAFDVLVENRTILDALVVELLAKETLSKDEVARIFENVKLRPARPAWTGSDARIPSNQPPVAMPAKTDSPSE
jgi:cell division protease FtsH